MQTLTLKYYNIREPIFTVYARKTTKYDYLLETTGKCPLEKADIYKTEKGYYTLLRNGVVKFIPKIEFELNFKELV